MSGKNTKLQLMETSPEGVQSALTATTTILNGIPMAVNTSLAGFEQQLSALTATTTTLNGIPTAVSTRLDDFGKQLQVISEKSTTVKDRVKLGFDLFGKWLEAGRNSARRHHQR
jgi:hypothetical protein